VGAVDSLCSDIGQNASVVFTDALTADNFAPVVRGMCGQPAALVLAGSSSGSAVVSEVVSSIERTGRHPVLLGASQSSVSGFGGSARVVVSLRTRTDPSVLNGPPAGTWPFTYTVWMAQPTATGSSLSPGGVGSVPSIPGAPSPGPSAPAVPSGPAPGSPAGA
jgi:hypothetical protein